MSLPLDQKDSFSSALRMKWSLLDKERRTSRKYLSIILGCAHCKAAIDLPAPSPTQPKTLKEALFERELLLEQINSLTDELEQHREERISAEQRAAEMESLMLAERKDRKDLQRNLQVRHSEKEEIINLRRKVELLKLSTMTELTKDGSHSQSGSLSDHFPAYSSVIDSESYSRNHRERMRIKEEESMSRERMKKELLQRYDRRREDTVPRQYSTVVGSSRDLLDSRPPLPPDHYHRQSREQQSFMPGHKQPKKQILREKLLSSQHSGKRHVLDEYIQKEEIYDGYSPITRNVSKAREILKQEREKLTACFSSEKEPDDSSEEKPFWEEVVAFSYDD
ncbi:hypothetical protein ADUPG1_009495 [Aduncisulcus paluster]|uniref:Uncharacterized protein n=1 Tax=Aduncisulcus paluster TaxID=2918883 RepID=A0ABQ5KZR0_9EUKA|nr:hypothetical protein ADUPG1_009495 [Aduncisulcus paluster]